MRYTVYNLKTDAQRKVHGVRPPNNSEIDEGRRNMISQIKPPEMVRVGYIEQALYPKVEQYAIPDDVKYEDVIDIKILSKYRNTDRVWTPLTQVYRRQFDQKIRDNVFAINWNSGVKTMSIFHPRGLKEYNHKIVNDVDSLTENGSWNVGGNVVDLRLDELNHITRKASLSFDINNTSNTGFIENFTMRSVNIEDYMNDGAVFGWLNLPIPKEIVSVKLTLGSNTTNLTTDLYYATVNQPHDNNSFVVNWNLLKYMLNDVTSVGNPNPKDIKYIRLDFTTTGQPIPNCNLNSIMARKGEVYEMAYNSSFCFVDALTGAWKQYTTANSDFITAEEDTYQILMLESALVVQKNIYGNNAGSMADVTAIENELAKKYKEYKRQHKAEMIEPQQYTNQIGRQYYGYGERYMGRHRHRPDGWFLQDGGDDGYDNH